MGPSSILPGNEKQKREEITVKGDVRGLPLFVGGGWIPVDGCSATKQVLSPTPTAIDKADFLVYVKQDGHKADNTKVPTHLWGFFFIESFLLYFGSESGTRVDLEREHMDVYQRHDWRRREGIPKGWENALDGFRRLGIHWWRLKLLCAYVS